MIPDILAKIVEDKKPEVDDLKNQFSFDEWMENAGDTPLPRNFLKSLRGESLAIIAELKKASPSKGLLCPDFDPVKLAHVYNDAGASAISVLTESNYFMGDREFLQLVKNEVSIPLLRKDFIFDEIQIPESRILGADAVLLITALLDRKMLEEMITLVTDLEMMPLVEVHDEKELETALEAGAELIGINNRNLHTFEVSVETTFRLMKMIPDGITIVSESGINNAETVQRLKSEGVHAILVGEHFVTSSDPDESLKKMIV